MSSVKITPLGGQVGAHHLHNPDRQRHLEVVEAVVDPVDDRAVGEDRGEAPAAGLEQRGLAAHVQEALVLSGKTRIRQVFGGRRTAHRDRDIAAALAFELGIGGADMVAQTAVSGCVVDDLARFTGALGKRSDIAMVETGQQRPQPVPDAGGGQRFAISMGGQGKAIRHADAFLRERRIKFAKRGVFAAHLGYVGVPQIGEPADITRFEGHEVASRI